MYNVQRFLERIRKLFYSVKLPFAIPYISVLLNRLWQLTFSGKFTPLCFIPIVIALILFSQQQQQQQQQLKQQQRD